MGKQSNITIPIVIEVGRSAHMLTNIANSAAFMQSLTFDLRVLLNQLGLPGQPVVTIQRGDFNRALRIRVHGNVQPYPPDLMTRVWQAVAPDDLRDRPVAPQPSPGRGFPDTWFAGYLSSLDSSDDEPGWNLASRFLTQLVLEIIRVRPSCLVGPAQAALYQQRHPTESVSSEVLMPILRSLLDLGVSAARSSEVLAEVDSGLKAGRSPEDIVEAAFARLRSGRIEIHLNPDYLAALIPGPDPPERLSADTPQIGEDARQLLQEIDQAFSDLGVMLPELVPVASAAIEDLRIAVKINDRLAPAIPGLRTDELLVLAPVEELAALSVPGRSAIDPISGSACASVVRQYEQIIKKTGLTAWTPLDFVVRTIYVEIARLAGCLISVEDVEYRLAQIEPQFPELVRILMARLSLEDITRVLRTLAQEGISTRDLRAILGRMLQYDAIRVDEGNLTVFDDRLVVPANMPDDQIRGWQQQCEFVRRGLKEYLSYKSINNYPLRVYQIDPYLDSRIVAAAIGSATDGAGAGLSEDEQEVLRDKVWTVMRDEVASDARTIILTTSAARPHIRALLAAELPNIPLIAAGDMRSEIRLGPIPRISLP